MHLNAKDLMTRALQLARNGMGRTSPNPMVGAVLLDASGNLLGEGWHAAPGRPHAEVEALQDAARRGHSAAIRGSTMVVTLEPCCHHGRTGPCTEALISAGVSRVIAACSDPNPAVAGRGFARLRDAGIEVQQGPLEDEAVELNAGFFMAQIHGRPLVTAKWAMTLDGRLATDSGHSRWITGEEARRHVHQWRAQHDAILVGSGTVNHDDPQLNVRLEPEHWPVPGVDPAQPRVIIIDGDLSIGESARVLRPGAGEASGRGQIIVTVASLNSPAARRLAELGATVISEPSPSHPNRVDLSTALQRLNREHGINSIYCEGGGRLHGALFDLGLIDRVHAYLAPKLSGGEGRHVPLRGTGCSNMALARRLSRVQTVSLGIDTFFQGWLNWPGHPPAENPPPPE